VTGRRDPSFVTELEALDKFMACYAFKLVWLKDAASQ
jgi:hypothetical protein